MIAEGKRIQELPDLLPGIGLPLLARSVVATALVCLGSLMAAPVASAEFPFAGQVRVSMMGQDGDPALNATRPDVAYDSNRGRYMVVWQGSQSETEGPEIYGKLVSKSQDQIGVDVKISDTPSTFASEEPTITFNRARDEFLVVWAAKRSQTGAEEIYGQRVAPSGDKRGQDFPVSTTGQGQTPFDASVPDLAYNSASDSYLAVWRSGDQADGDEIYGRMLRGDGTVLRDLRISTMRPDGNPNFDADDPSVAYDSIGRRFLVAWSGDDVVDEEHEVYTRAYDGDGSPLARQTRISHMGPDGDKGFDAFDPSLAFNPRAGEYLVVWRGDAAGQDQQFEVYAQRVNADGKEMGTPDFRVSDMGPDGNPAYAAGERPTVEYLSLSNRYLVLWHGDDDGPQLVDDEMEIFGQALGASGQAVGDNDFRVTKYGGLRDPGTDADFAQAAYNPQANQTLVVWQGGGFAPLAPAEVEVFSRRVGEDRDGDGLFDGEEECPTTPRGRFDADGDGCPDDRDKDGLIDELDQCPSAARGDVDGNHDGCPDDSDRDDVLDERDLCRAKPAGLLDRNRNGCPGPFGSVDRARLDKSVLASRRYIVVEFLRFRDLPRRKVTIRLRCIRGCQIKERLIKRAGRRTVGSRRFRGRRLRRGTVITARITAKDLIGNVRRYKVHGGDLREVRKARACIPIDSRRARKTCDRGR